MKLLMAFAIGAAAVASSQSGVAADLQVETPVVASASNWEGTYIGAFVGYGRGMAYQPDDESDYLPDYELPLEGATLGVTAGADFLISGSVIAGMVGDLAWSRLHGEEELYSEVDINWAASLRGKLGYDAGAFLPYLTGGLALAVVNVKNNTFDDSNIHFGWTAGVGTEVALSDTMSLDVLYRYSDYGQVAYEPDIHFSATAHTISVGLNWRY